MVNVIFIKSERSSIHRTSSNGIIVSFSNIIYYYNMLINIRRSLVYAVMIFLCSFHGMADPRYHHQNSV